MSDDEGPVGSSSGFDNSGGVFDEQKEREMEQGEGSDENNNKDEDALDPTGENDEDHIMGVGEVTDGSKATAPEERITTKYLTKYERARILGTRALQISMKATAIVDLDNGNS